MPSPPGSIGDKAHIAILPTQIGPEYIPVVDAIQNDKDPVNPTTIGNRVSNAEQTIGRKESPAPLQGAPVPSINAVQRNPNKCTYCKKRGHVVAECWKKQREMPPPRDHALKAARSECFRLTKKRHAEYTVKPERISAGPADFLGSEDQHCEEEGDDPLYSRTAIPVVPGHGGRSSRSRRDWYREAHAPGAVQLTPGVKGCVLRATRRDKPDQRAEAVARPLLGGGAPAERLCATPRTDGGDRLPCGGGSDPLQRANAMAGFSAMVYVGPALGPVIAGFLELNKDWRWSFFVLLWLGGATAIVMLTIPETYAPIILYNKAKRTRKANIPGYENVKAQVEDSDRTLMAIYKVALTRPWVILFDPVSLLCAIYMAVVYTLLYMLFSIYPTRV